MYSQLKEEIINIIEISNMCPPDFKEKCFEILLVHFIRSIEMSHAPRRGDDNISIETKNDVVIEETKEEEINESIFHILIKRLFKTNGITMKDINNLYYLEDGILMPLFDNLNTQKISDAQIRIALLSAFENGYSDNNLEFETSKVRDKCKDYKCYDGGNFMAIFKRNSNLFDSIEDDKVKLNSEGKKKLCEIILQLSRGE